MKLSLVVPLLDFSIFLCFAEPTPIRIRGGSLFFFFCDNEYERKAHAHELQ